MRPSLIPRRSSAVTPFLSNPLGSLREEMNDLFARFLPEVSSNGGNLLSSDWPSLDVSETDNEIQIKMDTPGLKAEELNIEITGDVLRISGEHEETQEESDRKYHRIERRSGSFERAIRLPCMVNEQQIDAECKDGVLTITLAKTEEAKPHRIPVKG